MRNTHFTPSDFVLPVVGLNPDGTCGPFLGTGVFVETKGLFITCDHVLALWEGPFGVAIESQQRLATARLVNRDADHDLAALRIDDYQSPHAVPFRDENRIILNEFVMCFEYGTTRTAKNHIGFSPANRLGNVTRTLDLTALFRGAGDRMLELSFPAMKGASGSPVMSIEPPFSLWGIVSANIASELIPAQIEQIIDEQGLLEEETRFYLPQGLAINVVHVRRLVERTDA